jgi:hypothetical protein
MIQNGCVSVTRAGGDAAQRLTHRDNPPMSQEG